MTQITYTVLNRPKKDSTGRTDISWAAECGRDAVPLGGYLITRRTPPGEKKQYTAMVVMAKSDVTGQDTVVETMVGTTFETRATAAFAIWRKYYAGWRMKQLAEIERGEAIRDAKRQGRARRRFLRSTPDGKEAYRLDLNRKARERRAQMTDEEKQADADKRRAKREHENFVGTYTSLADDMRNPYHEIWD